MNPSAQPRPIDFADRLLAEAVRALEHDGVRPLTEVAADEAALQAGGDFEHRLAVRASKLTAAGELRRALRGAARIIGLMLLAGLLVAAIAGASAARASLAIDGEAPVNVYWALGGLLGIQTLLLLVWIALMVKAPAALSTVSLGGVVLGLGRRLAARWQPTAAGAAALEAIGGVFSRGRMGVWVLGAVSHGLWVVFNAACLLLVVFMLSARHYRFVWETTILSADTYVTMTRAIAWLPSQVGFPAPTAEQIAVSDGAGRPDDSEATRHAWSGLLVGSIVIYGLAPRLLLLGVCALRQRRARQRFRLNTSRAGYLRLQPRLVPAHASLGVIDPDTGDGLDPAPADENGAAHAPVPVGSGDPAVFGVEIEPPSGWPPVAGGLRWRDLGFVDGRQDRQRVLAELGSAPIAVAVCGLTTTPDRGIGSFLRQARDAAGGRLGLVLTGGEALRRRGDGAIVDTRVDDWYGLARDVGLDEHRVIELDLDHLTEASVRELAELVGAEARPASGPERHLEEAFALIVEHLGRWPAAPDEAARGALHQAIGTLYRDGASTWGTRLGGLTAGDLTRDLGGALKRGAERATRLLPDRLRTDAKWAVAGAAAGALACVAAAFAAPMVLATLPTWSVLGTAVATAVRLVTPAPIADQAVNPGGDDAVARSAAVRGAALLALLLELQTHDEATITRLLDVAIGDDGDDLSSAGAARAWLDNVRHRLDLALVGEGAS